MEDNSKQKQITLTNTQAAINAYNSAGHYIVYDTTTTYNSLPIYETYSSQRYNPPMQIIKVFGTLSKTFNINMTEEELNFLDELFSSGDEQNKILANEMFKHMLNRQTK